MDFPNPWITRNTPTAPVPHLTYPTHNRAPTFPSKHNAQAPRVQFSQVSMNQNRIEQIIYQRNLENAARARGAGPSSTTAADGQHGRGPVHAAGPSTGMASASCVAFAPGGQHSRGQAVSSSPAPFTQAAAPSPFPFLPAAQRHGIRVMAGPSGGMAPTSSSPLPAWLSQYGQGRATSPLPSTFPFPSTAPECDIRAEAVAFVPHVSTPDRGEAAASSRRAEATPITLWSPASEHEETIAETSTSYSRSSASSSEGDGDTAASSPPSFESDNDRPLFDCIPSIVRHIIPDIDLDSAAGLAPLSSGHLAASYESLRRMAPPGLWPVGRPILSFPGVPPPKFSTRPQSPVTVIRHSTAFISPPTGFGYSKGSGSPPSRRGLGSEPHPSLSSSFDGPQYKTPSPRRSPTIAPSVPTSSMAICTDRIPDVTHRCRVVMLHTNGPTDTEYLLCDTLNGGLFWGSVPWSIRMWTLHCTTGINVTGFKVGQDLMKPVAADYFFPRYLASKMKRYIGDVHSPAYKTMEDMFEVKEFLASSYAYHERLSKRIDFFQRLPPQHNLPEYLGVLVDTFSSVECVEALMFKYSGSSLSSVANAPRGLRIPEIGAISDAIMQAVNHLHNYRGIHGNVTADNVFLTFDGDKIVHIVLAGLEKVKCGLSTQEFLHGMSNDKHAVGVISTWMSRMAGH